MTRLLIVLIVAYAAAVVLWQLLRLAFGDRWWWLGLANTLSLYVLLPSIALWLVALLTRRWAVVAAATVPVVVLLLLYGRFYLPRQAPVQAAGDPRLTVMTWNVFGGNRDAAPVEAAIRAVSPDIVAFQELNPRLGDELDARLAADYPYKLHRGERGESWLRVYSRYPLEQADAATQAVPRTGARAFIVLFQGQRVLLLNAHGEQFGLAPMILRGRPSSVSDAMRAREGQVRLWLDWIARHDGPAILTGDLNMTEYNTAYGLLAGTLQDSFRVAARGLGHTWPAFGGAFRAIPLPSRLLRLDYVWATRDWQVTRAEVVGANATSDHLPVVVELQLRAQ